MRRPLKSASCFLVLVIVLVVCASDGASAAVDEQVRGTCRSPREAMLQLLYWVQDGEDRVDPERAAACFDGADVKTATLNRRAVDLKRTLDARALYIEVEAIPDNPDYASATGTHRWRLPQLTEVEIVKVGERWLFSSATVRAIPALYGDTVPPFVHRIIDALPAWFHELFLGVRVWQLLGILLVLLFAFAVQRTVVFLVGTYIHRATGKCSLSWVKTTLERIARPIGGLVMAAVFSIATPWLQLSVHISEKIVDATGVLAVISFAWLAYRLIDVLTDWLIVKAERTQSKLDDQLVPLVRKTLKVFTGVIGAIFVLQNLSVDVGSLLAGLGLGGLAFALAARDTIANFFGSLVVFIDKPFQIGDWVVIGGVEGVVEEVGFRTTRVRTFYNSLITVPNAKLTETPIDNYGARRWRRYVANLSLTYDTPPQRVAAFCDGVRAIIQRLPGMRRDYALVEFNEYGESGLRIMVYCFMDAPDWNTELSIRTALNLEMLKLASDLGVSFAFPTRTLHLETQAAARDLEVPRPLDDSQLAAIVNGYGPQAGADGESRS